MTLEWPAYLRDQAVTYRQLAEQTSAVSPSRCYGPDSEGNVSIDLASDELWNRSFREGHATAGFDKKSAHRARTFAKIPDQDVVSRPQEDALCATTSLKT